MRSKVIALAIVALGIASVAQAQTQTQDTPPPPSQQRSGAPGPGRMNPDRQLAHMTQVLNLSADQQSQIRPLLVARQQKMQALFQDTSLSRADRRARAKTIREDTHSKIEAILNEDQKQKFEDMWHRMRGGPGNAPTPPPDGSSQPQ